MKVLNAAVPKEEGKSCNAKYQCLLNTLYLILFSNLVIYDCLIIRSSNLNITSCFSAENASKVHNIFHFLFYVGYNFLYIIIYLVI